MKPRILVPFDFEDNSHDALAWAADLHKRTTAEPILMLHAVDSRPVAASEGPVSVMEPSENEISDFRSRMLEAARKLGVRAVAEVHASHSPPGEIIIDLAGRRNIELIVMGTHGRSGLERLLFGRLGSVAEYVVHHATCAVVTVRIGQRRGNDEVSTHDTGTTPRALSVTVG